MKIVTSGFNTIYLFSLVILFSSCNRTPTEAGNSPDYYLAAYIWPSCHTEERNKNILWPEGIGEWEIIQKGTPRFDGHYQPKIPLWGYEMDDDPAVMEKWIDKAVSYGVNVFIFDWYWFNGAPFLESSLNNGFLKAENNKKMNFYIMWANHDVKKNYWNHYKYSSDSLLWDGATDWENYKIIVKRIIDLYFSQENYFKIDGCPLLSIFSFQNFIESFANLDDAKKAVDYFRAETKKAGFPDLHLQMIGFSQPWPDYLQKIEFLGVNSVTKYNWGGPVNEDYIQWGTQALEQRKKYDDALSIPYFPNVSIGWDDTPRFPLKGMKDVVHYNKSPESFASFMQLAKEYVDEHPDQPGIITINAWNEWVEGAYLLPDIKYGYTYLEAIKNVLEGKYE